MTATRVSLFEIGKFLITDHTKSLASWKLLPPTDIDESTINAKSVLPRHTVK